MMIDYIKPKERLKVAESKNNSDSKNQFENLFLFASVVEAFYVIT